jgi:hypothetical protein
MNGKLATLLERIDPRRTLDDADRRIDDAINSFPIPTGVLTRWEDFQRCVVHFHRHAEQKILGISAPIAGSDEFHWGRCLGMLMKAFGRNGEKAAFELTRTGVEGGINRVLREMARAMSEDYGKNWVETQIWNYWNSLSMAEKLAAPDDYLRQFGHVIPSEMAECSAGRIRANFPKFLIEHPGLVRRLRDVARRG